MTTHVNAAGSAAGPGAAGTPPDRLVAAPLVTRVAAALVLLGVVVQAALAGGFLAGRPALRGLHEYVGHTLVVVAVVVVLAGLLGRRARPERRAELLTRLGLLVVLGLTVFAGMQASRGTRDLLVLHIPLAFAVTGLSARLLVVGGWRSRRRP